MMALKMPWKNLEDIYPYSVLLHPMLLFFPQLTGICPSKRSDLLFVMHIRGWLHRFGHSALTAHTALPFLVSYLKHENLLERSAIALLQASRCLDSFLKGDVNGGSSDRCYGFCF